MKEEKGCSDEVEKLVAYPIFAIKKIINKYYVVFKDVS